ncbi:GntR family transcriptional regulator [Homoserinimonas sp. OAct 916]|uniref:GntR family transcriptional regulator n=1 Tax=Homoserinimonas sp. OAct 916 TaxID=2211450 RepID=UPI000DBE94C3|nr:GntR family transcriptional regulator [Homoserinimonas sp. OAct 916]
MFTDDSPIFQQLADRVAEDILNGTYPEDTGVPSTNEYASFYGISPITAAKGMNVLVEQGLLYKKRGIGMFVAPGAPAQLRSERRAAFRDQHVAPLLREAALLGIDPQELAQMINQKESS